MYLTGASSVGYVLQIPFLFGRQLHQDSEGKRNRGGIKWNI